jgi:hypothetical protein
VDKHRIAIADQWVRQWPEVGLLSVEARRDDETEWGGWYSRHNGQIEYIGDHITGRFGELLPVSILAGLLLALSFRILR